MRAIGFQQPGGIDRNEALIDIELPTPKPERRDLLVKVKASGSLSANILRPQ